MQYKCVQTFRQYCTSIDITYSRLADFIEVGNYFKYCGKCEQMVFFLKLILSSLKNESLLNTF